MKLISWGDKVGDDEKANFKHQPEMEKSNFDFQI